VQDQRDPAIDVIEALRRRYPAIELNIDASDGRGNPKISNLRNMAPLAAHENLLIADSDVEVASDFLTRIAAELQTPGVGAVTCVYHGVPDGNAWSRHAALGINSHFLPNVVLALSLDLVQPCFGSAIALRKSTLKRIGGFGAFAECLADDFAIGEAVRAAGYDVAIPRFSIGHICYERSLRSLFARELRAARTIRGIDPVGYCGALITHPFALALLGAAFGSADALFLALLALGCRGVLCLCVEHTFGLTRQNYHLIPVRDLLSFAVHVTGLLGKSVSWRGSTYSVDWGGRIISGRN
jgi:ceramide glucosyltransferase